MGKEFVNIFLKNIMICILEVIYQFKRRFLKTLELDPPKFLSAPGLSWQVALKKTGVELKLLRDIDMLLMV